MSDKGTFVMPCGVHRGKSLDAIASTKEGLLYLDYIVDKGWFRGGHAVAREYVKAYLAQPDVAREVDRLVEED